MRRRSVVLAAVVLGGVLLAASLAVAEGGKKNLKAGELIGYEENPDISTGATGSFKVTIDDRAHTLTYELTYSGLEGTVTQSHIHFGKPGINGGIAVFLCGTAGSPGPSGTPTCPTTSTATVSRTVSSSDFLSPASGGINQGIPAGDAGWNELVAALRSGHAYANVHSSTWPGGEIRAQIDDKGEGD
jgi:hypothetical protein